MILVFGAGGQVGHALLGAAAAGMPVAGCGREVDIADAAAVAAAIAARRPALVVNAAAWTAVDAAEDQPDAVFRVNATGAGIVASAAAEAGVPVLHLSTDYVFDGRKAGPYVEDDPVAPLGVYGRSKAAGEAAVAAANPRHVILRTAWVHGVHGRNFVKTMLRVFAERGTARVVADQSGTPTAAGDLATGILAVAARLDDGPWGIWHLAGSGVTTWYGVACRIAAARRQLTGLSAEVIPITTADYPVRAERPRNSALASDRFAAAFGFRAAPWEDGVDRTVAALLAPETA